MKKEYIAFIVAFVVSVVNTVCLFVHPAYREYKTNLKAVDSHFSDRATAFEKKIVGQLLPAVYQAITNNSGSVSVTAHASHGVVSQSISTNRFNRTTSIDGHYYEIAGSPYIDCRGFQMTVGDNFDGTPIRKMSPFCFVTDLGTYQFATRSKTDVKKD